MKEMCPEPGYQKCHHQLLHPPVSKKEATDQAVSGLKSDHTNEPAQKPRSSTEATSASGKVQVGSVVCSRPVNMVLLKIVPVTVTSDSGISISTFGLLDSSANDTLVTQALASKLCIGDLLKL